MFGHGSSIHRGNTTYMAYGRFQISGCKSTMIVNFRNFLGVYVLFSISGTVSSSLHWFRVSTQCLTAGTIHLEVSLSIRMRFFVASASLQPAASCLVIEIAVGHVVLTVRRLRTARGRVVYLLLWLYLLLE